MKIIKFTALFFAVCAVSLAGCKSKSNDSATPASTTDTTSTTSGTTGTGTTTGTGITAANLTISTTSALPGDLAIASNTEAVTASSASQLATAAAAGGAPAEGTPPAGGTATADTKQDVNSKKDRLQKAQNPSKKSDCFAAIGGMGKPMNSPTCYGPQVYYTKHPDHTSPTSGASTLTACANGGTPNSTSTNCLPGGDLGIWTAAEADGTACAAAKMNSLVQSAAESIDMAVGATGAMLCVAKLAEISLPAVGATLDLTATLSEDADMKTRMTVTAASITREADTATGRPVYTSKMDIALKPPGGAEDHSMTLTLRHVPLDDTNSTYQGLMTMVRAGGGAGKPPKPPEPPKTDNIAAPMFELASGDLNAVSVVYNKDATHLTYKVISANYGSAATAATIFNAITGEVDASKAGSSNTATDGWKGNLNVMIGTADASGDGAIAVGWQAGSQDGYTRNFNVSTATAADGSRTGTAYFGFSKNVGNAAPKLAIDGMICNWAGPNNQRDTSAGWNLVQKQTMKLNATTGIWGAVTSNITFAPTNSCDWTNVTDSTYSTTAITTAATKGVVTNDLVTKASGYTFTVPTAPTAP